MHEPRYNLLTERLIQVRIAGEAPRACTLPEVLSQLSVGEVESFVHLRPHQTHAWHAFLVQLAAIAMHQAGEATAPGEADTWRAMLLALTQGDEAPWCLVVDDLTRPALLQPPVPEGSLAAFKKELATPDALDILITAKNHDLKAQRLIRPRPEHWLYALLTLQTMEGFLGAGNYGIARMNGGFSNRSCVAIAPGPARGSRFLRDVTVLLESRDERAEANELAHEDGLALLWQVPWDGSQSLAWSACDPHFIEVCRRVRLVETPRGLKAVAATSKARRLQADDRKGVTGDAWTPSQRTKGTALTVSGSGFTYRLIHELLFSGDFAAGAAQALRPDDGEGSSLYAWALVRGQGVTEGLHERRIPLPTAARLRLGRPAEQAALGERAKRQVHLAGTMQKSVLKPALCALLQGGATKLDFSDARPARWLDAFDQEVDRLFFENLWADLERPEAEANERWSQVLAGLAEHQLEAAIQSAPIAAMARYRAIDACKGMFHGLRKKHFPDFNAAPLTPGEPHDLTP